MKYEEYILEEKKPLFALMACAIIACAIVNNTAKCERIKDIVDIKGLRGNPLSGVGLVVGLAETGDSSLLSRQMLTNILRDSGLVTCASKTSSS